jgi:ATP synthase (C/AC39) subunit
MPYTEPKEAGGLMGFNIHNGFAEALVRGYRSGFLNESVSVQCYHNDWYAPACSRRLQSRKLTKFGCVSHCCSFCAQDYTNLCQCENLDDVKLNLQETDYDQFLSAQSKVIISFLAAKILLDLSEVAHSAFCVTLLHSNDNTLAKLRRSHNHSYFCSHCTCR